MNKFILEIHTIEKTAYKDQAHRLTLPTPEGQITVLPGHEPIITALSAGEMLYEDYKGLHETFISGGFAEIQNKRVIVLTDLVAGLEELKEEAVQKEIETAKKRAEDLKKDGKDIKAIASASADLTLATTKLRIIRRRKRH